MGQTPVGQKSSMFLVDNTQLRLLKCDVPDSVSFHRSMHMKDLAPNMSVRFGDVVKGTLSGGWLKVRTREHSVKPLGKMCHVNRNTPHSVTHLLSGPSGSRLDHVVQPNEIVDVLEVKREELDQHYRRHRTVKCRRCGCSTERDADGERVCWCSSCWHDGCDFGIDCATRQVDIARICCAAGIGWLSFGHLQVIPMTPEDEVSSTAQLLKAQRRQPFDLQIIVSGGLCGEADDRFLTLTNVCFERHGELTTGQYLYERISAEVGVPVGAMRILFHDVKRVVPTDCPSPPSTPICKGAVLAHWRLESPSVKQGARIEVVAKQRGGKKPGNGWFKSASGRTCTMNIASAIARDTVFARAIQFCTSVMDGPCLDKVLRLCDVLDQDAVVLCGGGTALYRHFDRAQLGRR